MTPALLAKMRPHLTLFGPAEPNPAGTDPVVRAAVALVGQSSGPRLPAEPTPPDLVTARITAVAVGPGNARVTRVAVVRIGAATTERLRRARLGQSHRLTPALTEPGLTRPGVTASVAPDQLFMILLAWLPALAWPVGPIGIEVVIMPGTLARHAVEKGTAPRVLRHSFPLQVGSAPMGDAGRLVDQRLQPLFGRRISPDIELVDVEHAGQTLDRLVRDLSPWPSRADAVRPAPPSRSAARGWRGRPAVRAK